MFNKKNLSTCVAALFISLGIYAQTSQTYTTTSGLFRTDVDNFMNVTAWEAVDFSQTEKNTLIFADLNSSSISFGYAKEFSSLYFGTYIGGALPRFTEASYATTDYQVNVIAYGFSESTTAIRTALDLGTYEFPSISTDSNYLNASLLFGLSNLGIKLGAAYTPSYIYAEKISLSSGETEAFYLKDAQEISPYLEAGLNLNNIILPYFGASFKKRKATTVVSNSSNSYATYSGANILSGYAGTKLNIDTDGSYMQSINVFADYDYYFYPTYTYESSTEIRNNSQAEQDAVFSISYRGEYAVNENLLLAFSPSLPVYFVYTKDSSQVETTLSTSPAIAFALKYTFIPETLCLNLGSTLKAGSLASYNLDQVFNTSSQASITVFGGTYSTDFHAGLCWNITKQLTIDTGFSFASTSSSTTSVWSGSMGAQVEVKF